MERKKEGMKSEAESKADKTFLKKAYFFIEDCPCSTLAVSDLTVASNALNEVLKCTSH